MTQFYLRAGEVEVLVDSLPGLPDNIRLNDNNNYYVGLISPRIPGKPVLNCSELSRTDHCVQHLLELLGPRSWVRRFLTRLVYMVLAPVQVKHSPASEQPY